MTEIIKNWLTYKLGLEIPSAEQPTSFEKELANGVLIAEVLRKYGYFSDDEIISLRNNNTQEAKDSNMRHIKRWLNNSGLRINDSDLEDIANEKVGVGAKLLYELYIWFEYGPRVPNAMGDSRRCFLFGKVDPHAVDSAEETARPKSKISGGPGWKCLDEKDAEKPAQAGKSYAPHDRIEFPRNIVLRKPFVESSEVSQAQHLYFSRRTAEVLRKQAAERKEFARDRELRLRNFREEAAACSGDWCPDFHSGEQLDSNSIQKRKKERVAAARQAEIQNWDNEMEAFNWLVMTQKNNSVQSPEDASSPVFINPSGDPEKYEMKIQQLKCKKEAEENDSKERALFRKKILNRFTEKGPHKMLKSLKKDLIAGMSRLPASERLLAEYIHRCYKEKDHFINHAIYEAGQLQEARNLDLEKELRIQKQEEELRQYAASELANLSKSLDSLCSVDNPGLSERAGEDGTARELMERRGHRVKQYPPPPPPCSPTHSRTPCEEAMPTTAACKNEEAGEGDLFSCRTSPSLQSQAEEE